MRNRGGTCFKPSVKPSATFLVGQKRGDFLIERQIGYRGDFYEASCTRCRARTSFSFASLQGEALKCPCHKKMSHSLLPKGGNQQ